MQVLHEGGPKLWDDFVSEPRERHLAIPAPRAGRPAVHEQLETAYAEAIAAEPTKDSV